MLRVAARPSRAVTPASPARPPRAVPSRKLLHSPTRVQSGRREPTQSRAGCGHCPPSRVWALPTDYLQMQVGDDIISVANPIKRALFAIPKGVTAS